MWFDCEAWEPGIENDTSLLIGFLEQHKNNQVNDAAAAAVGLLVYYSKDWNETIESIHFQLFDLYQVKPLSDQVAIGKTIALFYSLYGFSELQDTTSRASDTTFLLLISAN